MLHKISTDVVTKSPDSVRAYLLLMRLDRPTGYVLYLLPGLWAVALASGRRPDPLTVVVVAVAAVLVRGAACAVNDVVDKDVDVRVARTVSRPVAAGTVSVKNALLFAAAQAVVALLVLAVANVETALVVGASYPLIVAYPYMKRIFFWPSAFLALVMSVYVLIGWTSVSESADYPLAVYGLYMRRRLLDPDSRRDLLPSGQGVRPEHRRQVLRPALRQGHQGVAGGLHRAQRRRRAVGRFPDVDRVGVLPDRRARRNLSVLSGRTG